DDHTNLGWDAALGGLTTHALPDRTRIALGLSDLTLTVLNADERSQTLPLDGCTDAEVRVWLGQQLTAKGVARSLDEPSPYEMPPHAIASGGRYTTTELTEPLHMLGIWYADADGLLGRVREKPSIRKHKAPKVRCWPHHFDLDSLVSLGRDRTVGLGFSPGDEYCDEPYFYASIYPDPKIPALPLLPPIGHWHTHEFVAAFAPAHKIVAAKDQGREIEQFFDVAIGAALHPAR
ncbi:unnamed protein product, partial [Phaeothamnion confervicola]